MEYITEPIEEAEEVLEETEEMYISPEEEAEMIKAQQMQQQQQQPQINLQDDYQLDQEDIILAQADRNVEVRVKKVREAELAAKLTQKQQQQQIIHMQYQQMEHDISIIERFQTKGLNQHGVVHK